jgi:pyridoxamine 5'-phosphate oxidase
MKLSPEKIAALRREYTARGLRKAELDPDPIRQFAGWFHEAVDAEFSDANSMSLATATPDGVPFVRTVLLKGVDERGFTFFTNYESAKGRQLAANPRASLLFFWAELERQVSIRGRVVKTSPEESGAYFKSRPLGSRLGAWVSKQSEIVASRDALEKRLEEVSKKYGEDVPLPPHWGGFRVAPDAIEFWQGRPNRLHDRMLYTRSADGTWSIARLAP